MDLIPNWVPSGYKTVNIYLMVKDAERALRFYNSVFGAETTLMLKTPDGIVAHSEFKIFDTIIMLAEQTQENPDPLTMGGTPVIVHLYVGDAEEVFTAAVDAGCEVIYPLKEQFYGDKAGRVKDPFGHHWIISRHLETLSPAEIQKRFNALYS